MGKTGGRRNFGYGKQMAWAGKNALADRYGEGRYATRAAHAGRWQRFVAFAREAGIRDARQVDRELVTAYGRHLADQARQGEMTVSYAQNLLSTVNVVLEALRGDRLLRVSPAALAGQRAHVRSTAPAGLERARLERVLQELKGCDEARIAAVAGLARELGLRFREASLLDARGALVQARHLGRVNITEGTKGGLGREVDRWVPVTERALRTLMRAAEVQGEGRNLVPVAMNFSQWKAHAYHAWSSVAGQHALRGFHDLRAAYACERYRQLTGAVAPVVAGQRDVDKAADRAARQVISRELGHGRIDVVAAYVGSAR